MIVTTGKQKALLYSLFYNQAFSADGQPVFMPKEFALEDLYYAGRAKNKVAPSAIEVVENGQRLSFNDDPAEFVPAEIVVLKTLLDAKKTWSVEDADTVIELKDIFYPSA